MAQHWPEGGISAWIGLVPKQMSTGDRTILGGISKCGNGYLRTLFMQAARVILLRPANWPKHGFGIWLARAAQRLHPNVLAATGLETGSRESRSECWGSRHAGLHPCSRLPSSSADGAPACKLEAVSNDAPECPRLLGALAVTDNIVRVPLERDVRERPRHPRIEHVMQEQFASRGDLRAAPPLRSASVLSPSRLEPLAACPFTPSA